MILVHGPDGLFVRDIVRYLTEAGLPAQATTPDAHLFSEVVQHAPRAVVGVVTESTPEEEALEVVQALSSASSAPKPPVVVLVTPFDGDAAHVLALKRSGAPYVIVRSSGLDASPLGHLKERTVWLSDRVRAKEHGPITKQALLAAIVEAVHEDTRVGIELKPDRDTWERLLSEAGARVRSAPNWLARFACFLGAHALYANKAGELVSELGQKEVAQALGAVDYARS